MFYRHGSSCLAGPVSRKRAWWRPAACPSRGGLGQATVTPASTAIRADLVERVRREIAAGTYDTEEKFEMALGVLMARLGHA